MLFRKVDFPGETTRYRLASFRVSGIQSADERHHSSGSAMTTDGNQRQARPYR